jgi:hypothetical protein
MRHQRRDTVLEASFIPAGERHIVGIGAYPQLTVLSIHLHIKNQQQETD